MRRSVLLVQSSLQPPGGGNGVGAWALQALAREHRVTVLSWEAVTVAPINRFFGTSLEQGTFESRVLPAAWRAVPEHLPVRAALLRSALLMRFTRRLAAGFDVVIGFQNEMDYGRPGIQYVHHPTYLRPRPQADVRWYHRAAPPLLHAYYAVSDRLARISVDRLRANVTLANSHWTAARLRALFDIDAHVVYPPVVGPAHTTPWEARRRGFVAAGRMAPEKAYERVIRILARVRQHAPFITLDIVTTREDRRYYAVVRRVAAEADPAGDWIRFLENIPREEMHRLLGATRYGIHGMRDEHFGMAPAEMAAAGMIVWVPDGGGQIEIVGDAPALRYRAEEEAATAILRAIHDPAEEGRLLQHLAGRRTLFSPERFMAAVRDVVVRFPPSP